MPSLIALTDARKQIPCNTYSIDVRGEACEKARSIDSQTYILLRFNHIWPQTHNSESSTKRLNFTI